MVIMEGRFISSFKFKLYIAVLLNIYEPSFKSNDYALNFNNVYSQGVSHQSCFHFQFLKDEHFNTFMKKMTNDVNQFSSLGS